MRAAVTRRVSRRLGLVEGGGSDPERCGALCVMLAADECRQKLSAFFLWDAAHPPKSDSFCSETFRPGTTHKLVDGWVAKVGIGFG